MIVPFRMERGITARYELGSDAISRKAQPLRASLSTLFKVCRDTISAKRSRYGSREQTETSEISISAVEENGKVKRYAFVR